MQEQPDSERLDDDAEGDPSDTLPGEDSSELDLDEVDADEDLDAPTETDEEEPDEEGEA